MSLYKNFFLSLSSNNKFFEKNPHIALGVSGGPDSMALLYLLNKWIKLKKGKLTALIFDHNIRPESKEESYQVKNMIKKFKIEVFVIKANKNKFIKKNMADARFNRFKGLINFCKNKNILHLFLGHNFEDNLETFLIRRISGSNLNGLASMSIVSTFNNIQIFRPLIQINKSSIISFNKMNKINYINDPSNKNINYTRVKVRNFLQNKIYKKEVKRDFLTIKKQIPKYKNMIWELLIGCLDNVQHKSVKVRFNKLIKFDDLIIEKHILLILNYLTNKKNLTKSSKINNFIDLMKKPSFKIFNLSGVIIKKKSNFLVFSQK